MATATLHKYEYQVRDRNGRIVNGELEGDSAEAVATKLKSMGYSPLQIDEVKTTGLNMEINVPGMNRVKLKDLAIFSRQFATMINSGLPLIRALTILVDQTENKKLAETIELVRADVEAGSDLSTAMAKAPEDLQQALSCRWSGPVRPPERSTRCCCASRR
jgi:type IV pilus assembly protein PilC